MLCLINPRNNIKCCAIFKCFKVFSSSRERQLESCNIGGFLTCIWLETTLQYGKIESILINYINNYLLNKKKFPNRLGRNCNDNEWIGVTVLKGVLMFPFNVYVLEMHRLQSEYENSRAFKYFIFETVNFYASSFYIAFFKGR